MSRLAPFSRGHSACTAIAAVALMVGVPSAARGQQDRKPEQQLPDLASPLDPQQHVPPAIRPTPAAIPGLENTSHRLPPPSLLREGSFIVRRRGSMARLPGGQWAFVFHRDAEGHAERPMVLIPSQTLNRMEQSAGDAPAKTVFDVTGEIFAYRGVNYLLPTTAPLVSGGLDRPPQGAAAIAKPAEPPPASPEVQDLIRQLELQRDRPRTLDAGVAPRPVPTAQESTTPTPTLAEGQTLVRRKGRMVRTSTGDWALAFDTGSEDLPGLDRPFLLIPSMTLQQMEAHAMRGGDAVELEVSGRILTYRNRNYLVPTVFQVIPAHELRPRP